MEFLFKVTMDESLAIKIATNALAERSAVNMAYSKVFSESRNGRTLFVVVFDAKESADVIISPSTRFVEVDVGTGKVDFPMYP